MLIKLKIEFIDGTFRHFAQAEQWVVVVMHLCLDGEFLNHYCHDIYINCRDCILAMIVGHFVSDRQCLSPVFVYVAGIELMQRTPDLRHLYQGN